MATTKKSEWHTGHALRTLIGEGRRTVEEAAMHLGVASATLYRYYNQPELPDRIVHKIAPKLGVSADWLKSGRGERIVAGPLLEVSVEQRVERMIAVHIRNVERETRVLAAKIVKLTSNLDVLDGVD